MAKGQGNFSERSGNKSKLDYLQENCHDRIYSQRASGQKKIQMMVEIFDVFIDTDAKTFKSEWINNATLDFDAINTKIKDEFRRRIIDAGYIDIDSRNIDEVLSKVGLPIFNTNIGKDADIKKLTQKDQGFLEHSIRIVC